MSAAANKEAPSTLQGEVQPAKKPKVTYPVPNQCMESGHFYVRLGEDVDVSTRRYKMLSMLGQGTTSKVVEAWDRQLKEYCAIKIVRNTTKYTRDAQLEVANMESVCQRDPRGEYAIVRIQRNFLNDQGHMCIVMPVHGSNLLNYIQKHGPLSLTQVAQVAYQLCRTLDFLHTQNRYVHAGLKPAAILLDSNKAVNPLQIRVCDLGHRSNGRHSRYSAPEVILNLGGMYPADMWSVGCILFELYTGRVLYDTHDILEHLNMMVATLGALPADFGARVAVEDCKPHFSTKPPYSLKPCAHVYPGRCAPIETLIKDASLAALIRGCLNYDEKKRLTARDVMRHAFVMKHRSETVQATAPTKTSAPTQATAPTKTSAPTKTRVISQNELLRRNLFLHAVLRDPEMCNALLWCDLLSSGAIARSGYTVGY